MMCNAGHTDYITFNCASRGSCMASFTTSVPSSSLTPSIHNSISPLLSHPRSPFLYIIIKKTLRVVWRCLIDYFWCEWRSVEISLIFSNMNQVLLQFIEFFPYSTAVRMDLHKRLSFWFKNLWLFYVFYFWVYFCWWCQSSSNTGENRFWL